MKKRLPLMVAMLTAIAGLASPVDVFIGTSGEGHLSPAAAAPFGMVQAGPDTASDAACNRRGGRYHSGYKFENEYVMRFSQNRLMGTGGGSLGNFGLLPMVSSVTNTRFAVKLDKRSERGEPGYYSVRLAESGIQVEVTALAHSAAYRFHFPAGPMKLLVDPDWSITVNRSSEGPQPWGGAWMHECKTDFPSPTSLTAFLTVTSWVKYSLAAAMEFSRPVLARRQLRQFGKGRGETWELDFGTAAEPTILELRLALSANSIAAAKRNLAAEMPDFDFDTCRRCTAEAWNELVSRVHIPADAPKDIAANLRSSLYRLCLQPNLISDVGEPPHYSTFSLWDTFRAAHPLYTLLVPERVNDFVNSLLRQYDEQGYLPIWPLMGKETHCMIGHHAVPVIVDAYLKGFRGFDAERAYAAIKESLTKEHKGAGIGCWGLTKEDWTAYDRCGYVPLDGMGGGWPGRGKVIGESVSRTMECVYDDACAARLARALGKTADAEFFEKRAGYWKNLLDPESGFVRGRKLDGSWRTPFDPYDTGHCWWQDNDFTEGNSWQWTFHVLHDPRGLAAALGGAKRFGDRLDQLFAASSELKLTKGVSSHDVVGLIGQYGHGNEPSHHIAFLYQYSDRPEMVSKRVRQIAERMYHPTPDGLCGNDDCGQMAAWYVFACLGFYPVDPCGTEGYVRFEPLLPGCRLPSRPTERISDTRPADARWESSWYPIGSGDVGVMLDGGTATLSAQFTVDSFWTGDAKVGGDFGCFQSMGYLKVAIPRAGVISDYRRELDFANAEYRDTFVSSEVSDNCRPVRFRRRAFASRADRLVALRIEYDGSFERPLSAWLEGTHGENVATNGFNGRLPNGLGYRVRLDCVREPRASTWYLRAATDFAGSLPKWGPITKSFAELRERHLAEYHSFYDRMRLDLHGANDAEERLFNFGRYLLISSSRPGTLPANLQGVWNDSNRPTWCSDYHTNINLQMNYWGADAVNLSECFEPMVDWLWSSRPGAEAMTRVEFPGAPGFAYRTMANVFGGGRFVWNLAGAPWLTSMLWEHYRYIRDREWLRTRAFPLMRGAAEFMLTRLKELPSGELVVKDGWSPEHGPREDGVTHDQQITRELFRDLVAAAAELQIEDDLVKRVRKAEQRLFRERIGKWGQLQEWMADRDVKGDHHRHTSQLFGVYPGNTITKDATPELYRAARVALEGRTLTGDSRRSWTWPWRAALWSRLGDNDKAEQMIASLLKYNTFPNLFTAHPPFQIDGNLGVLGSFAEILQSIQSGAKPPKTWDRGGEVKGLRLPNGRIVDFKW